MRKIISLTDNWTLTNKCIMSANNS